MLMGFFKKKELPEEMREKLSELEKGVIVGTSFQKEGAEKYVKLATELSRKYDIGMYHKDMVKVHDRTLKNYKRPIAHQPQE